MPNCNMMIEFTMKEVEYMIRIMGSCVSCRVVKILAAVPDQFRKDVMTDNCPVVLLTKVV